MKVPNRLIAALLSLLAATVFSIVVAGTGPAAGQPPLSASAATGPRDTGNGPSYNGLALTPPMGFNDWYQYRCGITEDIALANGRALVTSGLAKLGYDYVNLDDCWMAPQRAADGQLQADPTRFPHGMKWLADQLHSMGLKLGVYEAVGSTTCQGLPGSAGHYQQDADTFAAWGVDFLKFDYCGAQSEPVSDEYTQMSQALLNTGAPIVFSGEATIAAHNADPTDPNYLPLVELSSRISNLWRVASDFTTNFSTTVFGHLRNDLPLADYAHPGAWNDLDMLITGNSSTAYNFHWTIAQQETQMSIWSELASPLLVSTDLTNMTADTKRILGNKDVIAVDQDPLGKQGHLVSQDGSSYVVAKPLVDGEVAVLLVNASTTAQEIRTTAPAVGLPDADAYDVKDLWTKTTRETAGDIAASVPAGSAVLYRVGPHEGGVGQYGPMTLVSASPQVPAAYPGSSYVMGRPGQTIAVPATFQNLGEAAASHVSLEVTAPQGWKVAGGPVAAGALGTGEHIDGTWNVTIPAGTAPGSYTVAATATYDWSGQHTETESAVGNFQVAVPPSGTVNVSDLAWLSATSTFHDSIIRDKSYFGTPLTIHGVVYPKGLWANSVAAIDYYTGGNCTRLTSDLGLDDSVQGKGAVVYQVYADGTKVYDSGVVTNTTPTVHLDADVSGANIVQLYVGLGNGTNQYGNADFGNPVLTCKS